jgi:hypothetical protein
MDLMGSDAIQSKEDMHRMWGDGIQAVKGQHARIAYDDFLLLMKGQTKETPSQEVDRSTGSAIAAIVLGDCTIGRYWFSQACSSQSFYGRSLCVHL